MPYLSGAVCCKPWPWETEGRDKLPQCCKLQICQFLMSDTLVEMSHYTVATYITEGPEDNIIDSSSFACCSYCSPIASMWVWHWAAACADVCWALGPHCGICTLAWNTTILSSVVLWVLTPYCVYKWWLLYMGVLWLNGPGKLGMVRDTVSSLVDHWQYTPTLDISL